MLNADEKVLRYTGDAPFSSVEKAKSFIAEYDSYKKHGFGRWAVVLKETREMIGWCGFKQHETGVDLGYRFLRSHWGEGYATEAATACMQYGFEQLGFPWFFSRADERNKASLRMMQKMHMAYWKTEAAEGLGQAVYYSMDAETYHRLSPLYSYKQEEQTQLDTADKEALRSLWNQEYPNTIRHQVSASLDKYLESLEQVEHFLLKGKKGELLAWFSAFIRDGKRWFGMIVDASLQGSGIGTALLARAQQRYDSLNGWVIDKEGFMRNDGKPYRNPLAFYLKNDFNPVPEERIDNRQLSAVRICWTAANKV